MSGAINASAGRAYWSPATLTDVSPPEAAAVDGAARQTTTLEPVYHPQLTLVRGGSGGSGRGEARTGETGAPPAPVGGEAGPANPQVPGFPRKPPTDPGAGPYNSQSWYAKADDIAFKEVAKAAATAADALGYTNAARHLRHYLNNTGEDLRVDPARIARDVPQFGQSLEQQLNNEVSKVVQQAVSEGRYGEPIAFSSGWKGFYITKGMSADWFYAMGGVQHAVTGYVTVQSGNPPSVEVHYQTHVFDRYNWDGGKSTRIGPITVTDRQMGALHTAGLAREYDIVGSSEEQVVRTAVQPGNRVDVGAGPQSGSRDGERSDPTRDQQFGGSRLGIDRSAR